MISSNQQTIASPATGSVAVSVERKRILVVDDDRDILVLLRRALTLAGFHVDTAPDGNRGWEILEQNAYDLVVTDQNMPGMTGVELIRKIRGISQALPCVLFSSFLPASEEDIMKIVQRGAVLEKAATFSGLLTEIARLLHEPGIESPPNGFNARNFILPRSAPNSITAA